MKLFALILVTTLLMVLAITACQADALLGLYNECRNDKRCTDIALQKSLGENIGIFTYATVSKDWSEIYVGPIYKPTENSEILFGAGLEQGQSSIRWGGWSDVAFGRTCLEYDYEFGGSGYWYKLKVGYQFTPKFDASLQNKTTENTGIGLGYRLAPDFKLITNVFPKTITAGVLIGF